ncbi:MAG: hypothetical protein K4304_04875 [Propionicimonas sp.]
MSIRWTRHIAVAAATALAAGIALLGPAGTAQAAASVVVTGSTTTVAAARNLPFTFTINGTANGWGASVAIISTRVGVGYRDTPTHLDYSGLPAIGHPFTVTVPITASTTPGRYRVKVEAIQSGATVGTGYAYFTVLASTSYSRSHTTTSISGKVGRTRRTTFKVWAPRYQVGATAKVYYKFKGTKKYVKVAQGRLNSTGYAKMLTKKGKIRKAGRYYIKIGGVTYAAGYKTTTIKTYIRSY